MSYKDTLDYLYSRLPMFQRSGPAAYKPNLDNTIAICNLLGNPEDKFKAIHVAGTNGKGSVSHMLASMFQEAGYKTGLYTSPHLKDFRERIKINGKPVSKKQVTGFVSAYRDDFDKIKPSFFEVTVGMAYDYFAQEKVDIAIIETGLGGRLDSTNVITPVLSIITNISYDHVGLLGDTLLKIASEKAGIIKTGVPVVIGETQHEIEQVFREKARAMEALIYFADEEYKTASVRTTGKKRRHLALDVFKSGKLLYKDLKCELLGHYQQKNIITVLKAFDILKSSFRLTKKHLKKGLKNTISSTGLKGRWQIIKESPLTVCDTGHNEAGIKLVVEQINKTLYEKLHFVLGTVTDKEVEAMLKQLPENASYYYCRANIPRAMDEHELQKKAALFGLHGQHYPTVKKAFKAALKHAKKKDMVFIGGSTFVVAEVI